MLETFKRRIHLNFQGNKMSLSYRMCLQGERECENERLGKHTLFIKAIHTFKMSKIK